MGRLAARRFVTAIVGVTCLVPAALAGAVAAHADSMSAADYLSRLNSERSSHGLAPLRVSADLTAVAQRWSAAMADRQILAHNPQLTAQVSNWQAVGENVGEGPTIDDLDAAFWASAEHRANILDAAYEEVGVATVERDGIIWITVDFRQPLAGSVAGSTSAPPTSTTPTSTALPTSGPQLLQPGATGKAVARAQRILAVHDDGVFGPRTYRAVRHFQRRHHLLVDGVVGPQTRAALRRAARAARRPAPLTRMVLHGLSADGSI
jgi:murein L,D-transpeptidase YcbB/YkuD